MHGVDASIPHLLHSSSEGYLEMQSANPPLLQGPSYNLAFILYGSGSTRKSSPLFEIYHAGVGLYPP